VGRDIRALLDEAKAAAPSSTARSDPEWITCPATGKQCNDFCDPGKGDRCAESGQSFGSATRTTTLSLDEHFMANLESIMHDLDTVLMGDVPEDLGGISLMLETLYTLDSSGEKNG